MKRYQLKDDPPNYEDVKGKPIKAIIVGPNAASDGISAISFPVEVDGIRYEASVVLELRKESKEE